MKIVLSSAAKGRALAVDGDDWNGGLLWNTEAMHMTIVLLDILFHLLILELE